MTLEADHAVQEARFAGACQDQHAGRPAPSLAWGGLAKGNQSCNKPKQVSFLERKSIKVTGPGVPEVVVGASRLCAWEEGARAWGRGLQGLGAGASRALGPRRAEGD